MPHQLPTWGAEPRSHLPWRPAWKPSKAAQLRSHIDSSNKSRPNETNANSATLSPSPVPGQRLPSGEPSSRTLPHISVSIKPTVSLRASPYLIKKVQTDLSCASALVHLALPLHPPGVLVSLLTRSIGAISRSRRTGTRASTSVCCGYPTAAHVAGARGAHPLRK